MLVRGGDGRCVNPRAFFHCIDAKERPCPDSDSEIILTSHKFRNGQRAISLWPVHTRSGKQGTQRRWGSYPARRNGFPPPFGPNRTSRIGGDQGRADVARLGQGDSWRQYASCPYHCAAQSPGRRVHRDQTGPRLSVCRTGCSYCACPEATSRQSSGVFSGRCIPPRRSGEPDRDRVGPASPQAAGDAGRTGRRGKDPPGA